MDTYCSKVCSCGEEIDAALESALKAVRFDTQVLSENQKAQVRENLGIDELDVDLTGYATEEFVKNKIAEAELGGEEVDLSGYAQKSELPTKVSQLENDRGYLTEHQDISGKLDASELPTAINTALTQAKTSGEFDGEDGTSATHSWNGTVLSVSSASGTSSADLKGPKGDKGDKGDSIKGDKGDPGNSGVYILADGETVEDAPADANVIIDPNGSADSSGSGGLEVGGGSSASQPSSGATTGVSGVESWTLAKTVTTTEDALSVKIDLDDKYNEVFVYAYLASKVKLKAQIACLTHFNGKRCELNPLINASEQTYNIIAINPLPHEISLFAISGGGNTQTKPLQAKYTATGSYVELVSYDNSTVIAAGSLIEVYVR